MTPSAAFINVIRLRGRSVPVYTGRGPLNDLSQRVRGITVPYEDITLPSQSNLNVGG